MSDDLPEPLNVLHWPLYGVLWAIGMTVECFKFIAMVMLSFVSFRICALCVSWTFAKDWVTIFTVSCRAVLPVCVCRFMGVRGRHNTLWHRMLCSNKDIKRTVAYSIICVVYWPVVALAALVLLLKKLVVVVCVFTVAMVRVCVL